MTDMETWATPEWRDEIECWITNQLAAHGIRVTGLIEQPHRYPWSTVLRVPTSGGLVYCKATMTGGEHEVRLTAALAEMQPNLLPVVLAIDGERGWMLTRNAGPMLRTITRADPPNLAPWLEILPRYAALQIALIPHISELLALGAADHRLQTLPDHLTQMLADRPALQIGPPDGLTDDQIERLHALMPCVRALCDELSHIPASLDNGDLHDGNVFIGDSRVVVGDWGDACVTHPFFTLGITLRAAAHFAGVEDDAPPVLAMRDAYLEPWEQFATPAELRRAFDIAYRLSTISSAHKWYVLVRTLTGEERAQEADTVPYKLGLLLEALDAWTAN